MKKIFLLGLILFFICTSHPLAKEIIYHSEKALVARIYNFHVVSPTVIRGGQPTEKYFRMLKKICGVKTVLSLRDSKIHNESEKRAVERIGLKFFNVPLDSFKGKDEIEIIQKCLDIITDPANQPIFVHCKAGQDRTGMVIAAYRIVHDKWSFKDAFMEMLAYGFNRKGNPDLEKALIKWNKWKDDTK